MAANNLTHFLCFLCNRNSFTGRFPGQAVCLNWGDSQDARTCFAQCPLLFSLWGFNEVVACNWEHSLLLNTAPVASFSDSSHFRNQQRKMRQPNVWGILETVSYCQPPCLFFPTLSSWYFAAQLNQHLMHDESKTWRNFLTCTHS